jgi:tape measure domain-containing protein
METYSVKAVLSAVDSNFTSTMKTANSSLAGIKTASEGATSSIMKIVSGIGVFKALNAGASLLKGSISSAFGRQDTMEAFNRTITQITGSTENAKSALEELKGITKGTAYGLDVAAKATQNFVTRGMDLKKATKSVGAWADAVAFYGKGTNDELSSVTDAIAKMRTKGTVEMDQLNRMFDVGIDAVGIYAKAVGKSSQEVQDSLSDKSLRTEEFLSVVEKAMEEGTNGVQNISGAAKQAGASWSGTFDNMKAAVTRGTLSIIQAIDNMLSKNKLPQMRTMIAQFGQTAETVLGNVAKYIDGFNLTGMAPQLAAVSAGLLTVAGTNDYIKLIPKTFDLINKKVPNLDKSISKLQKKSKALGDNLTSTFTKTSPYLDAFKNKFIKLIPDSTKTSIDNFKNLINGSMSIGKDKVNSLGDSIAQMSFKFQSATGRFSSDAPKMWKVFNAVSNKINKASSFLENNIGKGLKAGTNVGMKAMSGMSKGLTKVFAFAMKAVGPAAILGLAVVGLGLVNGQFGNQIDQMIKLVTTKGPEIIKKLTDGVISNIPYLARNGATLISKFAGAISKMLPVVVNAGLTIIKGLIEGFNQNSTQIVNSALVIVGSFINAIVTALPQLLNLGLQFLLAITDGIINNMPVIIAGIQTLTQNIVTSITNNLPQMLVMGIMILQNIANGIAQALPQIIVGAIQIITALITTISSNMDQITNSAVEIITTLVEGMVNNLPAIINAIVTLIGAIVSAIINNLPQILTAGVNIIISLVSGLLRAIPQVVVGAGKVAKKIITTFAKTDWLKIGTNVIKGIAKGITGAAGQLWDAAKKALGSFKDKVLGFFGIHSPSRWGKYVGRMIDYGVGGGIDKYTSFVGNKAKAVFNTVSDYIGKTTGLSYDFAFANVGSMSGLDVNHYIDYNDRKIHDGGGDESNNEYYFTITNEMDGKTLSKATYKYDQQNSKKDEQILKKIRGDK